MYRKFLHSDFTTEILNASCTDVTGGRPQQMLRLHAGGWPAGLCSTVRLNLRFDWDYFYDKPEGTQDGSLIRTEMPSRKETVTANGRQQPRRIPVRKVIFRLRFPAAGRCGFISEFPPFTDWEVWPWAAAATTVKLPLSAIVTLTAALQSIGYAHIISGALEKIYGPRVFAGGRREGGGGGEGEVGRRRRDRVTSAPGEKLLKEEKLSYPT